MRLSTAEFAELLGVSAATLDAWERGDEPIDDATLERRLASIERLHASQPPETRG